MPKTITSLTPYTGEDVKKVRKKTGLSQNLFALAIGVTPMAVRNWEQGRVNPSGPVTLDCWILLRKMTGCWSIIYGSARKDQCLGYCFNHIGMIMGCNWGKAKKEQRW